jgi:hypothetical protein
VANREYVAILQESFQQIISEFFGIPVPSELSVFMQIRLTGRRHYAILLIPILVWISLWGRQQESTKAGVSPEEERIDAELQRLKDTALASHRAAATRFESKLDGILADIYTQEEWRINVAVDGLTGWKESAHLSYLIAYSAITGKSAAGDFIGAKVSSVFSVPAGRAMMLIAESYAEMEREMAVAANNFSAASLKAIESLPDSARRMNLLELNAVNIPSREITDAGMKTTLNSVGLAVDAVLIPKLCASAGVVLQTVVGRTTATLATSGTLIVADGPFPVGDAIAVVVGVGGGIWAACDLYHARKHLVPAVRQQLQDDYQAQHKMFRKIVKQQASTLLKQYENKITPLPPLDRKSS